MSEPPLICCWGGALHHSEHYEDLRQGHPERLVEEFAIVFDQEHGPDFDVMFLPNPEIDPSSRSDLRANLSRTFSHELLVRTPNPAPRTLGFLGYSAGACVTCLALDLPNARAVGTVGGVGMAETILDTTRPLRSDIQFAAFINSDDPLVDETLAFQRTLRNRGRSLVLHQGIGSHSLRDYLRNGLLSKAGHWIKGILNS